MMSISSNDRPFVSGMSLYVRTRGKHHYVSSKKDKRHGCDTHREKVAIAPMLIVANMRKILYPRSLTSVGVTFDSTKSIAPWAWTINTECECPSGPNPSEARSYS